MTKTAAIVLLALGTLLAGCSKEVRKPQVAEFIDKADNAARKRFAPEICELRGKNFKLTRTFYAQGASEPSQLEITRNLFCQEAGKFSQLRQYRLERKSIDIDIATDRKTATVTTEYEETLPYYEPFSTPRTPDDFERFQVVDSTDVSVVGLEDGDMVFLSTNTESHQALVPKSSLKIPYD